MASASPGFIPAYSDKAYWERRYISAAAAVHEPSGPPTEGHEGVAEWYLSWDVLRSTLCDDGGPLGSSVLRPPGRVLELGCGDASLAPGLSEMGFAVLAVDFSPKAASAAFAAARCSRSSQSHRVAEFAVMDVRTLPLADESFEAVVDKGCFDSLKAHHCAAMLTEVCRVLRPGGRFFCVSNNETLVRSHARRLTGWTKAAGTPFCIPGIDDEIFLHCYLRTSTAAPVAREAPAVRASIPDWLDVRVPWAQSARDVELFFGQSDDPSDANPDFRARFFVGPSNLSGGFSSRRSLVWQPDSGGALEVPPDAGLEVACLDSSPPELSTIRSPSNPRE
ncbi:unnamed protein product [Polarella glacialis]|uniref:Methyltransferase type 11 domain-containing protein n=1 Tax=Polarella glacialis TaxID=89957 RepID=A0A813M477_POLGL|nr:unnamed protein product [Polarella glacialis]